MQAADIACIGGPGFHPFDRVDDIKYYFISDTIAVGRSADASMSSDVWCFDTQGVLTLSVQKETYEQLGLQGYPLPWKACKDIFGACVLSYSVATSHLQPSFCFCAVPTCSR